MRKYTIPSSMAVEYLVSTGSTQRLGDHLGSTSITTDANGAKISEMRYKPCPLRYASGMLREGEIRYSWTSNPSTTPAYKLPSYTFTGQYSHMDDPSTAGVTEGFGLMFYNARWMDPALGRFSQSEIRIYRSTSTQELLTHPRLLVHEIGHAFYWAAGGYIAGSSIGERNAFYGPHYRWQFGQDSQGNLGTEIFADMFVGWVYGKWERGNLPNGLSINGQAKSAYMDKYMPLMIDKATGR